MPFFRKVSFFVNFWIMRGGKIKFQVGGPLNFLETGHFFLFLSRSYPYAFPPTPPPYRHKHEEVAYSLSLSLPESHNP